MREKYEIKSENERAINMSMRSHESNQEGHGKKRTWNRYRKQNTEEWNDEECDNEMGERK